MRIAVISDTHYYTGMPSWPIDFWQKLIDVDGIIHAGDIGESGLYTDLQQIAPVIAVMGNNDSFTFAGVLPERQIVQAEKIKIGIFHGHRGKAPFGFGQEEVNLVICGHTHVPRDEMVDGIRILNPGSVTRPRGGSSPSIGILEINEDQVNWQLCFLTRETK